MDLAALIVAGVSMLFSGGALGWKVAEWLMSAGRARCYLMHGAQNDLMNVAGPVGRDERPRTSEVELQAMAEGIVGGEVLGVEVQNVGRSPLIVTDYSAVVEKTGISLTPVANAIGPELPHTVAAGDAGTWWVPMHDVMATIYAAYNGQPPGEVRVHMRITTPHRQVVKTKRSIRLTPGSSPAVTPGSAAR